MKLSELKKAAPVSKKSSGTDDPSKYVGKWEEYTEPQGINDRRDRKVLAKEGALATPHDFLLRVSPTVRKAEAQMNEMDPVSGATVAFLSIMVGGNELTTVGPFDYRGAVEMEKTIEADIARGYRDYHPYGWTDASGTVYMLDDWEVNIETCHSSECGDIINARMAAAQARKDRIANGRSVNEGNSFGPEGTTRFAPDPAVPGYDVGQEEEKAIKASRKAPKDTVRASAKALSARGKPPKLNPYRLDEAIRKPFLGSLNAEYEVVDDDGRSIGYARVTEGVIEVFDYLTEATEEFRGHIMSALLHQIVVEADLNRANLSMLADQVDGETKYVLERFGFKRTGGDVFKRGHGSIRPASVPSPQGL